METTNKYKKNADSKIEILNRFRRILSTQVVQFLLLRENLDYCVYICFKTYIHVHMDMFQNIYTCTYGQSYPYIHIQTKKNLIKKLKLQDTSVVCPVVFPYLPAESAMFDKAR
jgi:hypothetical protein